MSIESYVDTGNIVAFEHVNYSISDLHTSELFFLDGLGLTRDGLKSGTCRLAWINFGKQQFHLIIGNEYQHVPGFIALIVPSSLYKEITQSLEETSKFLIRRGTSIKWELLRSSPTTRTSSHPILGHDPCIKVIGPCGNTFLIYEQSTIYPTCSGFGMPFLELICESHSLPHIESFYRDILQAKVSRSTLTSINGQVNAVIVCVGPGQCFIFRQVTSGEKIIPYDGYHVCIYVADFTNSLMRAKKAGLLYANEMNADKALDLDEAMKWKQFRTLDLRGFTYYEQCMKMEHEIRSMTHSSFMRPLINRTAIPIPPPVVSLPDVITPFSKL